MPHGRAFILLLSIVAAVAACKAEGQDDCLKHDNSDRCVAACEDGSKAACKHGEELDVAKCGTEYSRYFKEAHSGNAKPDLSSGACLMACQRWKNAGACTKRDDEDAMWKEHMRANP